MVVQHNLSAMNTNRQLGIVTDSMSKSTEKLSSGYRINRAADDAAGLSISEKLRSQIIHRMVFRLSRLQKVHSMRHILSYRE